MRGIIGLFHHAPEAHLHRSHGEVGEGSPSYDRGANTRRSLSMRDFRHHYAREIIADANDFFRVLRAEQVPHDQSGLSGIQEEDYADLPPIWWTLD
jgi:hypothetical protein